MKSLEVTFDIDGTLLDNTDPEGRRVNPTVFNLIIMFARKMKNCRVSLYSARPFEQQYEIVNRLGLKKYISGYYVKGCGFKPDIHFDDQHDVELGVSNVIVRMK